MRPSPGCSPWATAGEHPGTARAPDRSQATLFLRSQSASLRRGLEQADHRPAVGIVLGAHDASHEAWLGLIGALEESGRPGAEAVAALYTYHGRVVGFLERGFGCRLEPGVRTGLRALMTARLDRLTEAAVTALDGLAGRDPALRR